MGRYSFLTWVACSDEDDDISPNNLSLPRSLLRLKMSYSVRLKSFFAFPSLPFLPFPFRDIERGRVGHCKSASRPRWFWSDGGADAVSKLKKEKWSGCCDGDGKRGSKPDGAKRRRDPFLYVL